MTALEMFLRFLAAIVGIAALAALVGIALLLFAAAKAEAHARPERDGDPYEPAAAEAPDDVMAVADGLGFQRAEPWTGDNVIARFDRPAPDRRLSDGWIAYAEAEFDWHAAEYMATRKAARR